MIPPPYVLGQRVYYGLGYPEPPRLMLAIVREDGVECIDPIARATFEQEGIDPLCLWEHIERIEPMVDNHTGG